MRFVKMHGIGNDYVYVDAVADPSIAERPDLPDLARRISDRHTGIGSDGLILVCLPTARGEAAGAHVRMRMFNSDGSESEMCGNGVRCVAKFAHDRIGIRHQPMLVETGLGGGGVLSIAYEAAGGRLTSATVDMGEPILDLPAIPVDAAKLGPIGERGESSLEVASSPGAEHGRWIGSFVSMGNPHAVYFDDVNPALAGDGLAALDLPRVGPAIEHHAAFPRRVNAHFVQVHSRTEATMRTWERGAGATRACGTGACAVLVAGVRTGRVDRRATLHLPGGDLTIARDEKTNHVFKTGPAEDICEGDWPLPTALEQVVWMHQPDVLTARLRLRVCVFEDAARIAELAGAKEIAATTALIPHPYRLQDATSWLATHRRAFERGEAVNYAITLREDAAPGRVGDLVGMIGLRVERAHGRAELGYWIGVPFWGRGYATEAARALVAHGFEKLGLRRIFAYHLGTNPASGRVLAAAGLLPEGTQRGHLVKNGVPMDCVLYGLTRG